MEKQSRSKKANAWTWVPTLYFAEGIPYVIVMTLSVILYKRMGISNSDIALYTSWLYLPWVIKFLWSPIVDILRTRRLWIIVMQLFIGAGLAGVAFTIPVDRFFQLTLAFFWLLAFSSATHDIAADGFYMLGLSRHDQAFFVGIRSTFYRLAMLTGQGLLVILAGHFESKTGLPEVEVNVSAVAVRAHEASFSIDPSNIEVKRDSASLYFFSRTDVEIPIQPIDKSIASDMQSTIDAWNIRHNFYDSDDRREEQGKKDGWWKRIVSDPLAAFLGKTFSSSAALSDLKTTGNIGYTWFCLSRPPDENQTVVLNFSHESGDKSISLVRDYRFEFNEDNWHIPAVALFSLDPKLDKAAQAGFSGVSGNIALAWSIVFVVIAALFVLFFLYHRFMLPRPAEDVSKQVAGKAFAREFIQTFVLFFKRREIGVILLFLLVYRLGESQLVKLA